MDRACRNTLRGSHRALIRCSRGNCPCSRACATGRPRCSTADRRGPHPDERFRLALEGANRAAGAAVHDVAPGRPGASGGPSAGRRIAVVASSRTWRVSAPPPIALRTSGRRRSSCFRWSARRPLLRRTSGTCSSAGWARERGSAWRFTLSGPRARRLGRRRGYGRDRVHSMGLLSC
jgi:hypothetical protein